MNVKEVIKSYAPNMIEDIRSLVGIKSVKEEPKEGMPFGEGPAKALKHALSLGEKLGFASRNLDNYCGYIEMGHGEDVIGILAHVDVVPEGSGWTHAPYAAEIVDGKIYGRGVADDKGPAVIAMYAMKIIKDMGIPLHKRVRLVFGADEESGMKCVEHYKKIEGGFSMGFSPDAAFPLIFGEKGNFSCAFTAEANGPDGIKITDIYGGEAKNVVAPSCTVRLSGDIGELRSVESKFKAFGETQKRPVQSAFEDGILALVINGVSAHASTPELGINAVSLMMKFLSGVMGGSPFVNLYNKLIATEYDGQSLGVACADEYGALTLNIGLISMKDGKITATIDIRYPITVDFSEYALKLQSNLEKNAASVSAVTTSKPLFVDPDSELVQSLYQAYVEVTGDNENKPYTIGGGTYSRAFENVVAYGIELPGRSYNIHNADEAIAVDEIYTAAEVYVNAIQKLLAL